MKKFINILIVLLSLLGIYYLLVFGVFNLLYNNLQNPKKSITEIISYVTLIWLIGSQIKIIIDALRRVFGK